MKLIKWVKKLLCNHKWQYPHGFRGRYLYQKGVRESIYVEATYRKCCKCDKEQYLFVKTLEIK